MPQRPVVAYFCAEYALSDQLPIYAGGLGILAGDYVREAADQNMPMVAIGLMYHQGYFHQSISETGRQNEHYHDVQPTKVGLTLVKQTNGHPLKINLPYKHRHLTFQVWQTQAGSIKIYLLDSKVPENLAVDQDVTRRLYEGDEHVRIKQEFILGVGGVKVLHHLGIHPKVYHLNEGHSAFAVFEIARQRMDHSGVSFSEGLRQAKQQVVFTNHTIVPAGNDIFPTDDVVRCLEAYAHSAELPIRTLLAEGSDPQHPEHFSMTILALHASARSSAVSQLHGHMAKTIWPHHRFHAITNGVHMPTWVAANFQEASRGLQTPALDHILPHVIWALHQTNKYHLLAQVKRLTGVSLRQDALTLVWARRFALYKRPTLMLHQIATLRELAEDGQKLQVIIAGKAHPKDEPANLAIEHVHKLIKEHQLQDWVVFVPDYRMDVAKLLVSGADVWVNTPIRGQEASGTSGMKAGANGGLMVSTDDGWMAEVDWRNIGWILPDAHTDHHFYKALEQHILPMYQLTNDVGIPAEWVWRMTATMKLCWEQFSATRMLNEYQERLYQPLIEFQTADDAS